MSEPERCEAQHLMPDARCELPAGHGEPHYGHWAQGTVQWPYQVKRYRRAYIGGTFDLLHRGHHALFAATRRIAGEVVVSLNTDAFAARYKRQPVQPLADRLMNIQQLRSVDAAVINVGDEDSRPAILLSGADCVVHGSDWTGAALLEQMTLTEAWLEAHGIALVILPYTPWTSTTQVLETFDSARQPSTCLHGNDPETCAHCQMWRDRWPREAQA